MILARDLTYLNAEKYSQIIGQLDDAHRLLSALIKKTKDFLRS